MSFIETITSGNIAEGVTYYVNFTPGTFITYNSIIINVDEYFVGVAGVATYTRDTETEEVFQTSIFSGIQIEYVNTFFIGKFADNSIFSGIQIETTDIPYFSTSDTTVEKPNNAGETGWNDWSQKIKINPANDPDMNRLTGQDNTNTLDYAGVNNLITTNSHVTATVAGTGLMTNLKTQS